MKTVNLFRIEIRRIKSNIYHQNLPYGVHLRTKIIENKVQFEVQKLDYPFRNLVI